MESSSHGSLSFLSGCLFSLSFFSVLLLLPSCFFSVNVNLGFS